MTGSSASCLRCSAARAVKRTHDVLDAVSAECRAGPDAVRSRSRCPDGIRRAADDGRGARQGPLPRTGRAPRRRCGCRARGACRALSEVRCVCDASALLELLLATRAGEAVDRVLRDGFTADAPALLDIEVWRRREISRGTRRADRVARRGTVDGPGRAADRPVAPRSAAHASVGAAREHLLIRRRLRRAGGGAGRPARHTGDWPGPSRRSQTSSWSLSSDAADAARATISAA